jgi:hypothetical protein
MNSALNYGFQQIESNYKMAKEILEVSGNPVSRLTDFYLWESERLIISGALECCRLQIEFCRGAGSWCLVLNISSRGTIQTITNPSISQLDAGEGNSEENFIPWQTFLVRAHRELFGEDDNANS